MRLFQTQVFACLLVVLSTSISAQGRLKAATNFETGTAGQNDHESLSFYLHNDGGKEVHYRYGKDFKEVALRNLGPRKGGEPGFSVGFPNKLVLDVTVQGDSLHVRSRDGSYDKTFRWQYEGPVNGIGTACVVCVEQKDAAAFVTEQFAR